MPQEGFIWIYCCCSGCLSAWQVTISDQAGETLKTINFKGEPLELCVASCKDDAKGPPAAKKPVSCSDSSEAVSGMPQCSIHTSGL
jgi:hypothetical protein